MSEEVDAVIGVLFTLPGILIAVLPERTARKTGASSGLPPSRTGRDETARRAGSSGKGAKPNLQTGDNLRKTTVEETGAHMLSLRRAVALVQAISGLRCRNGAAIRTDAGSDWNVGRLPVRCRCPCCHARHVPS